MSLVFSPTQLPIEPGAFFRFITEPVTTVRPVAGSVLALPLVHNWGPANVAVALDSYGEWTLGFGKDLTAGERAVRDAFRGEDLPDALGAGRVIVYRMGTAALAKATRVLQNTTPANAVTVDGRYPGTRGNALRVAVEASAVAGHTDLVVYDGTQEVERYTHAQTDLASLAATVNANSPWVSLTVTVDGVALATVAAQALAGGNDGTVLTAAEWLAALAALEVERFSVIAPFDLTDAALHASLVAWAKTRNARGKRVMLVLGGTSVETVDAGVTAAKVINDGDIVRLGGFVYADDVYGDSSPSQLAPRIAGIIANRLDSGGMSYARLAGGSLKSGADDAAVARSINGGLMTLGTDSRADAPVHVIKGITTFSTGVSSNDANVRNTYRVYRNVKYVRVMQLLEVDFKEMLVADELGRVSLDSEGKELGRIVTRLAGLMRDRAERRAIQGDWTIVRDPDFPIAPSDEHLALRYGVSFQPTLEQVFGTIVVQ